MKIRTVTINSHTIKTSSFIGQVRFFYSLLYKTNHNKTVIHKLNSILHNFVIESLFLVFLIFMNHLQKDNIKLHNC